MQSLHAELNTANLAAKNEREKNITLSRQIELSNEEKACLRSQLVEMEEINKENAHLKVDFTFIIVYIILDVTLNVLFRLYRILLVP